MENRTPQSLQYKIKFEGINPDALFRLSRDMRENMRKSHEIDVTCHLDATNRALGIDIPYIAATKAVERIISTVLTRRITEIKIPRAKFGITQVIPQESSQGGSGDYQELLGRHVRLEDENKRLLEQITANALTLAEEEQKVKTLTEQNNDLEGLFDKTPSASTEPAKRDILPITLVDCIEAHMMRTGRPIYEGARAKYEGALKRAYENDLSKAITRAIKDAEDVKKPFEQIPGMKELAVQAALARHGLEAYELIKSIPNAIQALGMTFNEDAARLVVARFNTEETAYNAGDTRLKTVRECGVKEGLPYAHITSPKETTIILPFTAQPSGEIENPFDKLFYDEIKRRLQLPKSEIIKGVYGSALIRVPLINPAVLRQDSESALFKKLGMQLAPLIIDHAP